MQRFVFAGIASIGFSTASLAQEPHRHLGPHEHGRGYLSIAIEGNKVLMALEAPGSDIGASEAAAETAEAKAALASALAQVEKPLELFRWPDNAGCKVVSAKAEMKADDDGDDDDHDHSADATKPGAAKSEPTKTDAHKDGAKHQPGHADLHAEFELNCAAPANLTSLQLEYFRVFPKAQKVTIQVTSPKGQGQFDASPAASKIELAGIN